MRRLMSETAQSVEIEPHDLARQERGWKGVIPLGQFERLSGATNLVGEGVAVELAFSYDPDGRCHCVGVLRYRAEVECHRCLEAIDLEVTADLDLLIASDDAAAKRLAADNDVVVVNRGGVTITSLVEDDAILALPSNACSEGDQCENAPATKYPADAGETTSRESPFAALRHLREGR